MSTLVIIGRFADAEPLLQRALTLPEKIFGPEHPYVARGLQNLAENYRAQGLYENAESFHRKALAIWEKDPSKHCFEMARSLNLWRRSAELEVNTQRANLFANRLRLRKRSFIRRSLFSLARLARKRFLAR